MSSVKYETYSLPEKKEVKTEHPLHCIPAISNILSQQRTREPPGFTGDKSKFGELNLLNIKLKFHP